ncbi:hypothetical protein FIU94_13510 [Sulfitobacter sp. THAF37]|uniref:hypothetical protein n=1 Tax=Sulfitobacter sp. THAF37 TaxID=2587855 RepID=UPI0012A91536|nr:hypothetical protein [Sulfitobacter sp. THAF37]QFT59845.1 hypothetical protein FIU94_13510 [Sulfitobacter sp. THAF37]
MNPIWLMRMAKWARNPPSAARVKLVLGAVVLALLIIGIEWMGWWPDWATAERVPRRF